jgi:hypothetical protein
MLASRQFGPQARSLSEVSRAIIAVVLAYLMVPVTFANADEIWTCTYPGLSDDRRPVIVRMKQKGEFLVEEQFGTEYKILQNNEFGIVATMSLSKIERNLDRSEPSIGARTYVIDKRTGELLWSNTFLRESDQVNAPVHGSCIRG